jgi:redox-sensitive bicupin YhaK (pirin superfamily)
MASAVLQTVPLGFQWPTVDPFLFCVHHLDHYPAGNDRLGPNASLAGRPLGQDFEGIDGWRMYHGQVVPGFPAHPHRGFETVTYVRRGLVDHSDSLGAAARYGRGDVQWMTAGNGIVHAEMFPLLDPDADNTLELFQIWINLPAESKMVDPHFSMFWDHDIERLVVPAPGGAGPDGPVTEITVIAGAIDGVGVPSPPPDSWASRPEADVAIWHLVIDPGASWTLPPAAGSDTVRLLYVFDGDGLVIGDGAEAESVPGRTGAVVVSDRPVRVAATPDAQRPVEVLMLQGRPIAEPVARYGPFVMNTEAEIRQAFADYRRTQFGGWPWPADDPTHSTDPMRFARHADGRVEQVMPA